MKLKRKKPKKGDGKGQDSDPEEEYDLDAGEVVPVCNSSEDDGEYDEDEDGEYDEDEDGDEGGNEGDIYDNGNSGEGTPKLPPGAMGNTQRSLQMPFLDHHVF